MADPTVTIEFDNDNQVYYTNQNVSGKVKILASHEVKCKSITLMIKGSASVYFTTGGSEDASQPSRAFKVHTANQELYVEEITLFDGSNSNLQVGDYEYPFSFKIPLKCPSTYENEYGNIRHMCRVSIDKSGIKTDVNTIAAFTVIENYDMNELEEARDRLSEMEQKKLGCICWRSGRLSILITTDKSGFVPGEQIIFNLECVNKSNSDMVSTSAELIEESFYFTKGKLKIETRTLDSVEKEGLPAGKKLKFSKLSLRVPPIPPTTTEFCKVVKIRYILKLKMTPSALGRRLILKTEVFIGTIPLLGKVGKSNKTVAPAEEVEPLESIDEQPLNPSHKKYSTLPRYSYKDSSFGQVKAVFAHKDNTLFEDNKVNYTPKYLYYDFPQI